ncbi:MAG: aromatic ring-hydroxylating dioxygenase subunit alpha [Halioglobus sp.]
MTHPTAHTPPLTLIERLVARAAGDAEGPPPLSRRIPVGVYTEQARFEQEKKALFERQPMIIGHESQLPEAGDTLVFDWLGIPLITVRDKAGNIGTFMNVCRHRGMRLVQEEGQTQLRSMVCPYHQWTYGLDGDLRNIPLEDCFVGLDKAELGLVALPTEVRHGLIWIQLDKTLPMDLDAHLAELGPDLDTFAVADYSFFEQSTRTINCNWKLIQDAFLDGYHVVRLHKNTVGPFFPDSLAESDLQGNHIRSAVARNEIFDAVNLPTDELNLRLHATFSYTVFPNAVMIFHPDYTSIISLFPLSPDQTIFVHTMLTPQTPSSEKERAHFQRSFAMIDKGVFEAEDIFASEGTQRGLRSGANEGLLFGAYEATALQFHDLVEQALK